MRDQLRLAAHVPKAEEVAEPQVGGPRLKLDFTIKRRDFAVKLPKFDVVAVKKVFCSLHGLGIVEAVEGHRPVKVSVRIDDVGPVFHYLAGFGTSAPSLIV
jgi:hypothetical protein